MMPSRTPLASLFFAVLFGCGAETPMVQEPPPVEAPAAAPRPFRGVPLVPIPAGAFTMGSPLDEVGRYPDEVQHRVTLSGGLSMGPAPITQAQFSGLMGYDPSSEQGIGMPVTSVTWHQAAAFTNALSAHDGLDACYSCEGEGPGVRCRGAAAPSDCPGYRLPTEAEWEYAARGGLDQQAFPNGGGLLPADALNCAGEVVLDNGHRLGREAWHCGLGGGVQAVVQLDPNGYGLFDMSGNTWEWCHDWYAPYAGDAVDPWGPEQGDKRVARGGSAKLYYPQHLRVAFRLAVDPATPAPQLGFRVVKAAR